MRKGKSFVASLMALALVVTAMPSNVFAQSTSERTNYSIHGAVEVDESSVLDELWKNEETVETPVYGEDEMVTLIVELEDAPVMDFYDVETYSTDGTATVGEAVADFLASEEVQEVSDELLENQEELIASIEELVEDSEDAQMEVHAQWTIATNAISISVPYGKLSEIRKMEGVKRAYVEHTYDRPEPVENSVIEEDKALYSYSYDMVHLEEVWGEGFTGKGMLVAVLDSGIDIKTNYEGLVVRTHEAFTDDSFYSGNPADGENDWELRYTSESLADFLENNQLVSTTGSSGDKIVYDNNALYKTLKVPYAADYADGDVNVLPTDSDHGTHVSGTIAGYAETEEGEVIFSGVAPDAQILFMKVFPDEDGGATESTLVNALEDSLRLGADVINLSLGSDNGYAVDDTIQNDTFARVEAAGIVMMTSAGNSAYSSEENNYDGHSLSSNPDNSMISSPAVYASNLAVASIDNAIDVQQYLTWTDSNGVKHEVPFADPWSVAMKSDFSDKEYPIYAVGGVGSWSDYNNAGFDNGYNGGKTGIALVKRGEISFSEKIQNALSFSSTNSRGEKIGVMAVIVYDADPEATNLINMSVDYTSLDSCFISGKDGAAIADAIASGYEVKIQVSKKDMTLENPTYGELSSYSSWGAGPGLELKPEITAPGGNIWSSVIDQSIQSDDTYVGNYELMSGTSMAAPHMSGIAALVRQYILSSDKFEVEAKDMGDLISQLLVSTAVPQVDKNGVFYSPRQQGAGLVDAAAAIKTPAYITVEGKNVGKLELLDDPDKTGAYELSFDIHNISSEELRYNLEVTLMRPDTGEVESPWGTRTVMTENDVVIKKVSFGEVVVPANSTITVDETVVLSRAQKTVLDELFENGTYVEGFVSLTSDIHPTIGLPVLAFYGDWTKAPIFDSNNWIDEAEDGENVFNNESTWATNILGSCVIGNYGILGYLNLGQNVYDSYSASNQGIYYEENITISPDGNGFYDCIDDHVIYQLRNARLVVVEVKDSDTGEVYFREGAAYPFKTTYNANIGAAFPYSAYAYGLFPIWEGTDTEGKVLPSGTHCTYTITAYGEGDYGEEVYDEEYGAYVTDFDAVISGEKVPTFNGHEMDMTGDVISFPVTVDTEAPKLVNNAVSMYEEDGRVYMEGTVYDADGSLAYLEIFPYVTRSYKPGYGDSSYSESGMDRSNPFHTEYVYDAGKKELKFKVDVTEYNHTNESYAGENYYYDFAWTGNVVLSCGDYGANDRSYAIKVDYSEGLVLSQTSARLHVGSEFELSVNNNTGLDAAITRTSSRPEVATVDEFGMVVAKSAGQTVITVSNGVDVAHCVVVVDDYNTTVEDFELSIDSFKGLKPNGEAVVKVTNLQPADVVLDEIIWSVEESDEYAEEYGEGLINVGKQSSDGLSGYLYLNVAASTLAELPASVGTLTVTLNGVSRTMEIGWDDIYSTSDQDDLISALDYSSQVVYVTQGETAELSAKYRQGSLHSVGEVITVLDGVALDGADFFAISGSYTATLVNEAGYTLPSDIEVYTVYDYGYEYPMYKDSPYGYFYNSETGEISIPHAPSGATNKLKIVATGVESEGAAAGTMSGTVYEKPDELYGPFDWAVTEGAEELTGKMEKAQKTDYYGISYEVVEYTPSEPGISYITATTKDGKYSVNFAVVCEPVKASGISVDKHSVTLEQGDRYQMNATLSEEPSFEEDEEIIWKSYDESVAVIDENGVITAVSDGFAFMLAYTKADNRVSDYCVVKVTDVPGFVDSTITGEAEKLTDTVVKTVEVSKESEAYTEASKLIQSAEEKVGAYKVFDISLKDLNGNEIPDLDGYASITMDIPEDLNKEHIAVYRVDDTTNAIVKCEATVDGGKLTFKTNHVGTHIIAETMNTLAQGTDKNWYDYVDGHVSNYTGLRQYNGSWWYVKNGKVDFSATTLCQYNGSWWYVKNGKVDFGATTLCHYNGFWWYVKGGKVDFGATTLCQYNGSWWYVKGGKVDFGATTLCKYNGNWWYVKGGKVDFGATTLCQYNGSWWYVKNGKVDFGATTLCKYNGSWWYVKGGKVDFGATTLCKYNGSWWYVKGGKVDFGATTLCKYNGSWWYVKGGKVNFGATTLCKYNGSWWYVKGGKVDFSYTGTVTYVGAKWYVKNGVMQYKL